LHADRAQPIASRLFDRVWCKACQHSIDADLAALIRDGHGDKPIAHVKWRCANCGSRRTDAVVMGSHITPKA
jgi:hypothetical protein